MPLAAEYTENSFSHKTMQSDLHLTHDEFSSQSRSVYLELENTRFTIRYGSLFSTANLSGRIETNFSSNCGAIYRNDSSLPMMVNLYFHFLTT